MRLWIVEQNHAVNSVYMLLSHQQYFETCLLKNPIQVFYLIEISIPSRDC